jgi:hypothetical protein
MRRSKPIEFVALLAALCIASVAPRTHAADLPPAEPIPLFASERGGLPGTPIEVDDPLSLTTWQVDVAVVPVARNPRLIRVPLGARLSPIEIAVDRFEPREGFSVDDRTGDLIVSDDPSEVSYYWMDDGVRPIWP